ncbi:MAG: DUF928 domain-containing protein [Alphaproteobacteria bacterium]|nr:DUF928 domain-containing protein [Alphaproteobacteria bacterium]
MASFIWRSAGALCLAVLLFQAASAQTKEPDQNPAKDAPEKPTIAAPILIYNPPDLGAPTVGVAGATKPLEPTFGLLAPAHMGLTAREAPTLYWYLAGVEARALVFTLSKSGELAPVLTTDLKPPTGPGLNRVDLAKLGVKLKPEQEYFWSIVAVLDPQDRSHDLVKKGYLMHRQPGSNTFEAGLPGASAAAQAGYWYDAVHALGEAIRRQPDDATLRQARASLMEQVGLWYVANLDRAAAE